MMNYIRQASDASCQRSVANGIPRRTFLVRCISAALALSVSATAESAVGETQSLKSNLALRTEATGKLAPLSIDPILTSALIDHARATLKRTLPPGPVGAIAVTNCADSGAGSLRDAMANAADGDTIDMTNLKRSAITLTTGSIVMSVNDLTLQGPGALDLAISGNNRYQPLHDIWTGNSRDQWSKHRERFQVRQ